MSAKDLLKCEGYATRRFELVINATTAKALVLAIPPTLLAIADEMIE